MKFRAAITLLVVLVGCKESTTPAVFDSSEGNFRVVLPGRPRDEPQTQAVPGGTLTTHTCRIEDADKTSRSVSYSDLPEALIAGKLADPLIDAGIKGMGRTWNVSGKTPIDFHGHPAAEVGVSVVGGEGEDGKGKCRIILAGHRLYQVMILGPISKMDDKTTNDFLDSFALQARVERIAATPPPPNGGASIVEFRWADADQDVIGGAGDSAGPDGTKDQHLVLGLDLPLGTSLEGLSIHGAGGYWGTKPGADRRPIAVRHAGETLIAAQADRIGSLSGKVALDLFLNMDTPPKPYTRFMLPAVVRIEGQDHTLDSQCPYP